MEKCQFCSEELSSNNYVQDNGYCELCPENQPENDFKEAANFLNNLFTEDKAGE